MAGFSVAGAAAFVTGASSGIGRGDEAALRECAAEAVGLGARASVHAVDLTDAGARRRAFASCVELLGRVDLLVNCAGLLEGGEHESIDQARQVRMVELNLTAPSHLCALVLPGMKERRRGCLVNVSSMSGRLPIPFTSLYAGTKAGIAAFSEALSREVAGSGVLVVTAFPGATDTPMLAGKDREAAKRAGMRIARAERVAESIVRAVESGRKRVYPSALSRGQAIANVVLPELADRMLVRRSRELRRFFAE
jgi:short-subunit dehydrogenase